MQFVPFHFFPDLEPNDFLEKIKNKKRKRKRRGGTRRRWSRSGATKQWLLLLSSLYSSFAFQLHYSVILITNLLSLFAKHCDVTYVTCSFSSFALFSIWLMLVPQLVVQLVPQLAHVASCGWWTGDGESMWGHSSTNYNSPHGRVMAYVVAPALLFVFPSFWSFLNLHVTIDWHLHWKCWKLWIFE